MKSKYFKKNKISIHLDQFAISEMAEGRCINWSEIKELLLKGYYLKRIICPISVFHRFENIRKDIELTLRQDEILRKLSAGWSFRTPIDLISMELLNSVKKEPIKTSFF